MEKVKTLLTITTKTIKNEQANKTKQNNKKKTKTKTFDCGKEGYSPLDSHSRMYLREHSCGSRGHTN